jgi:hypothetical protein
MNPKSQSRLETSCLVLRRLPLARLRDSESQLSLVRATIDTGSESSIFQGWTFVRYCSTLTGRF